MTTKRAIILRGPPCSGKSSVSCELFQRLKTTAKFVSLDDGWNPGERRFKNDGRYVDLESDAETLVIELGFGEPNGESFAGATRNPNEWLTVLKNAKRSVHVFLLQPSAEEVFRRIAHDRKAEDQEYFRCAAWRYYRADGVCTHEAFGQRLGGALSEHVIDTGQEPKEATASRILQAIGATVD
jgi:hypothetical protein